MDEETFKEAEDKTFLSEGIILTEPVISQRGVTMAGKVKEKNNGIKLKVEHMGRSFNIETDFNLQLKLDGQLLDISIVTPKE